MCCFTRPRFAASSIVADPPARPSAHTDEAHERSTGVLVTLLVVLLVGTFARSIIAQGQAGTPKGDAGQQTGDAGSSGKRPPSVAERASSLPPLPATDRGTRLPLDQSGPHRWNGIREGVSVAVASEGTPALEIRYDRKQRTAAGVAFLLPPGSFVGADELVLRMACAPTQRLFVCATDAAGVVWSFPTISVDGHAEGGPETHTLKLAELAPDRWQNSGKQVPERPDPSTFAMLTILDISGHMGGQERPCVWRLESAEILGGKAAAAPKETAPGAAATAPAPVPAATQSDDRAARRAAHALFFDALQSGPQRRAEAIAALDALVTADARDARSTLLLGLAWLWTATDPALDPAARADALAKSAVILDRAAALAPDDDRIPTWQLSARHRLALLQGRQADADRAREALRAATERDPCFHSLAFGMMAWDEPRDSAVFADAVRFAQQAMRCGDEVSNGPRWPFGVQGFLVMASDLFSKAGDFGAAQEALVVAESMPGTERWPHRAEVTDRLATLRERIARFTDGDAGNDPAPMFGPVGTTACTGCHGRRD